MKVKFRRTTKGHVVAPTRKTKGAACFDFYYPYQTQILHPGETKIFKLGIALEIPEGYYMEIRGRSSLSSCGILCPTGIIDNDYRGEIGAVLTNTSDKSFFINTDERICQGVICKMIDTAFVEAETLSETERGCGGFGSTGK